MRESLDVKRIEDSGFHIHRISLYFLDLLHTVYLTMDHRLIFSNLWLHSWDNIQLIMDSFGGIFIMLHSHGVLPLLRHDNKPGNAFQMG